MAKYHKFLLNQEKAVGGIDGKVAQSQTQLNQIGGMDGKIRGTKPLKKIGGIHGKIPVS